MATRQNQRNITTILRTSQQKAFSTGLLTIVLVSILLVGSFRPTVATILETNQKFEEKQQLLATLVSQNQRITQLAAQKQEVDMTLKSINRYFPHDGNFALFVINVNQIALTYRLNLKSISFSESLNNQIKENEAFIYKGMTPTTFQIAISGDRTNLYSFLSYLESTPFFPKIISVQYGGQNVQSTDMTVAFVMYKLENELK